VRPGLPEVFDVKRRPWIRAERADAEAVAEVVRRCLTGALHYRREAGEPEEPTRPTTITVDPQGTLLVRGDLVLSAPEGAWHETRAALCRCGRTGTSRSATAPAASTSTAPPAPGTRRGHREASAAS
jgi:Divergent 4Fe-4S mono-cluster